MTTEGHSAPARRAASVRLPLGAARGREALRCTIARGGGARLLAVAGLWAAAAGGFAVFVASLDSVTNAYGGVGVGVALLLWLTLFSILYHVTPGLRGPARGTAPGPPAAPAPLTPPAPQAHAHAAIVETVDLVVTPSAALRNPTAQGRMMSVLGPRATGLSDREVDMMDWGFAFGVAWAVARNQDPGAAEEVVSERALRATQAVYEAYRGNRGPAALDGRVPAPVEG